MSTSSIIPSLNIPYIYPVPTLAQTGETITQGTIDDVYSKYLEYFKSGGTYDTIKGTLLDQLKTILGRDSITVDELNTDAFYLNAQKFDNLRIDKDHCREGYMAYRFYLKEIGNRIITIDAALKQGQEMLELLKNLSGTSESINNQAHAYITQLEINDKLIYDELKEFLTYYKYNEDTKQWDIQTLNVFDTDKSKNYEFSQIGNYDDYNKPKVYIWKNNQWNLANGLFLLEDIEGKKNNWFFNGENIAYYNIEDETWYTSNYQWKKYAKYYTVYYKDFGLYDEYGNFTGNHVKTITIYTDDNTEIKINFNNTPESGYTAISYSNPSTPFIESKLQNLRALKVATSKSDETTGEPSEGSMQLTSFNSLTLFDRLKYIRYYYRLMFSQDINTVDRTNSRFPDDSNTGYPCMPDVPSVDAKQATQSLGALELFYVGYLINRDGPVNALSSFFEVKVNALRNNVALSSKKIEALNLYLDFINIGLDQLNKNSGKRPSDGSVIALTYLCGQNMYNLLEDEDGNKYFVIPSLLDNNQYFFVKADDSGKKWLLGDTSYEASTPRGNSDCYLKKNDSNKLWVATRDSSAQSFSIETSENGASSIKVYDSNNPGGIDVSMTFKVPTQIECTKVSPSSVKNYSTATSIKLETKSDNNVLGSWTDAFSRKTQFINTSIDTINTDVTLNRSKIDTFDSLTSTFRSRAQDTYQNILSNIRS